VSLAALAHGYLVAARNESRPPQLDSSLLATEAEDYYREQPRLRPFHDQALAVARRAGCGRLGLHVGGDSYDYPLSWRAHQAGIEVRHLLAPDPWPCVVFSDRGEPPSVPGGRDWVPAGSMAVWVRAPP
jgi:hypothetical protein